LKKKKKKKSPGQWDGGWLKWMILQNLSN